MRFNVGSGAATVGSGVTASVAAGATLELAGSVSALFSTAAIADRVAITNDSQAVSGGLLVSGTNQQVGAIDGMGNTILGIAADLTANHIRQNAIIIGGAAGQSSKLIIAPSDAIGNPFAESLAISSAGGPGLIAALAMPSEGATEIIAAPHWAEASSSQSLGDLTGDLASPGSTLAARSNGVPELPSLASAGIGIAAMLVYRWKGTNKKRFVQRLHLSFTADRPVAN